jgi:acid phosphatase type 7
MRRKHLLVFWAVLLGLAWPGRLAAQDPVLVGAGDCCSCYSGRVQASQATATLLASIPGTVFAVGDIAYLNGTDSDFAKCYDPTWGGLRSRTVPIPGNHEYNSRGGLGYYGYFGAAAADPMKGYYSFDLGAWHILVLNSNCPMIGGCGSTSPQGQWLQADLAAHPALCTLALFHYPFYSSTTNQEPAAQPLWAMLYAGKVDLIVNGHAHNYERFAPQDANGNLDLVNGIPEIVAGTGGNGLQSFTTIVANSLVHNNSTYGVLKLTLHSSSYDWQFIPIPGGSFTDSGTGNCH